MSAATLRDVPRNLTHCCECDRPFPEPVLHWDDFFVEVEDASFVCESCGEDFARGEDHYGR